MYFVYWFVGLFWLVEFAYLLWDGRPGACCCNVCFCCLVQNLECVLQFAYCNVLLHCAVVCVCCVWTWIDGFFCSHVTKGYFWNLTVGSTLRGFWLVGFQRWLRAVDLSLVDVPCVFALLISPLQTRWCSLLWCSWPRCVLARPFLGYYFPNNTTWRNRRNCMLPSLQLFLQAFPFVTLNGKLCFHVVQSICWFFWTVPLLAFFSKLVSFSTILGALESLSALSGFLKTLNHFLVALLFPILADVNEGGVFIYVLYMYLALEMGQSDEVLLFAQIRPGRHRHELRDPFGGLRRSQAPLPGEEARLPALGHWDQQRFFFFFWGGSILVWWCLHL